MGLTTARLRLRRWRDEDLPAYAARDYGFRHLSLEQIVSFTVPANRRSRNVMARIGMTHSPDDDFEHPLLPEGHPLRQHVLYRLARAVK
jgi:RimJ/RimL family protein N-acetyltransferase